MGRPVVLGLALCLLTLFPLSAAEPVTRAQVDALVAQLVSPNNAPEIPGPTAKYPPGYDREAQKKVRKAFFELRKLGPPAFPFLIEHFEDKRYSLTEDGGAAMSNWSVGRLCFDVIDCQLQPYGTFAEGAEDPRTIPRRPSYSRSKLRDLRSAKDWCDGRKDKALRELQIEVLEWVIAEERKTPAKYSGFELQSLSDLLQDLRANDKLLEPSVPWAR